MSVKSNLPTLFVVLCHLALALQNDEIVTAGWLSAAVEKTSLFLCRDGRVASDEPLRHNASQRLDTERQRDDVEEKHVLHIACENAPLDCCTNGDDFVWVNPFVRLNPG